MVQITEDKLESFLSNYGWAFKKVKDGVWRSGWQGAGRSYPLKISLCDTWLSFEIDPLVTMDIEWDSWPEISSFLLELNHHCRMVKVSLNDSGGVCLVLEVFTGKLDYSDFSDAMGVIGFYADYVDEEFRLLLERIGYSDELGNLPF